MDNVAPSPETNAPLSNQYIDLESVPITDENVALNVLIAYLNNANKAGVFSFSQSAKIWECIKMFVKPINPDSEPLNPSLDLSE